MPTRSFMFAVAGTSVMAHSLPSFQSFPRSGVGTQPESLRRLLTQGITGGVPTETVTAIKLSRQTGRDCRYPEHREVNLEHREVNLARRPWHLGSGIPCRHDALFLNLMAVETMGTMNYG